MNEYPNDGGYPPPYDRGGTQPGAPSQGGLQAWPAAVPPAPPVAYEPLPDPDGMYKEGWGYGLWLLWLFGLAGIHRIYMGKYGTGILWLMTWGLFGIGQFIDVFRMKSLIRDANIREGYLPHPRFAGRLQGSAGPASRTATPALAPRQNVQQVLLKAAQANGGALTVTQGVVTTGLTFEQVEEVLREMVAKGYVDVDNAPNSGVVVYRFPELAGPFN